MPKKERNPHHQDLFRAWEQLSHDQQLRVFITLLEDLLQQDDTGWLHNLMILLTTDFDPQDDF